MKFPTPKFLANTSITIQLTNGNTDENGAQITNCEFSVLSRFEETNSKVFTKDGQKISLAAKAFIFEGFEHFPDEVIGKCIKDTVEYQIFKASKKRNPDNSINHIVLELV